MKHCAECRNAEHTNFDEDVRLTIVRNPDTNRIYRRAYMCNEHREMYHMDDFDVYVKGLKNG